MTTRSKAIWYYVLWFILLGAALVAMPDGPIWREMLAITLITVANLAWRTAYDLRTSTTVKTAHTSDGDYSL